MKICSVCNQGKNFSEFSRCGKYRDRVYYRPECKDCNRKKQRESGKDAQVKYRNSEKGKLNKGRHKKTPEYREQQRIYAFNRRKTNALYKLKKTLRNRTRLALKRKRWANNSRLQDYIGCSLPDLKLHIERQFQPGMSWNNHGSWHIDHIIPLDSAETAEAMYKLCHFTNLQPLWSTDNLKKGSKLQ